MAKLTKKERALLGFSLVKTLDDTTQLIGIARGSEKRRLKRRRLRLSKLLIKI